MTGNLVISTTKANLAPGDIPSLAAKIVPHTVPPSEGLEPLRRSLASRSVSPSHSILPTLVRPARVVPLAQVTLDVLARHLAAFPARTATITDRTDPHKPVRREARLVFTLDGGQPVSRHTWAYLWRPAARAAELAPRTGLHALRHQYASLLIRHGESVKTVQKRMGHSSAAITLDTYSHVWPDADDRTREAVQLALGGGSADYTRTSEVPS